MPYTGEEWQQGLERTLTQIKGPRTKFVVLGNTPTFRISPPDCLAEHPGAVQRCSTRTPRPKQVINLAEQRAVTAEGGRYISVLPWLCAKRRCSPVIGGFEVYLNQLHITASYSLFLEQALAQKLQLSKY